MSKMTLDYMEDVEAMMTVSLKSWLDVIRRDGCYVEQNHTNKWPEVRIEILELIKRVVFDLFGVDGEYRHFQALGYHTETVNDFILEIETLLRKFQESPPFTLYYFAQVLTLDKKLNYFSNHRDAVSYSGLKEYKRRVVDLIIDTETEVIVNNVYHEDSRNTVITSSNQVHAVKYLRLLIKSLNVESSCEEVLKCMTDYKSSNSMIRSSDDQKRDTEKENDGEAEDPLKLVKIGW